MQCTFLPSDCQVKASTSYTASILYCGIDAECSLDGTAKLARVTLLPGEMIGVVQLVS